MFPIQEVGCSGVISLHSVYDEKLGVPLVQKDYAADCRLITPEHPSSWMGNITDHLDVFSDGSMNQWSFLILNFLIR